MLQEIDEILVVLSASIVGRVELLLLLVLHAVASLTAAKAHDGRAAAHIVARVTSSIRLLRLKFLNTRLQSLDDFLAEVRSLGQLLLNFLMNVNVTDERLNLLLVLIVLQEQFLSLLRLELELGRELTVLEDGEAGRRLQLLIVQREQVRLGLFDLEQHLLSQLLSGLNLLTLLYGHLFVTLLNLIEQFSFEVFLLLDQHVLLAAELCKVLILISDALHVELQLILFIFFLALEILQSLLTGSAVNLNYTL